MGSFTNDLPPEIIILICEQLGSISSQSLLHLCLTSKKLYDLAYPILFYDVRLTSLWGPNSPLLRFASSIGHHQNDVHSMAIGFSRGHMSAFLTRLPSAYSNLESMAALLPCLTSLKTFILELAGRDKKNTVLPNEALALLIRSLPRTVRNLEIDTEGVDKIPNGHTFAIDCHCDALASILPQLHHLRLRKGYLCSKFLIAITDATRRKQSGEEVQVWPLQSLTIRLDPEKKLSESPDKTAYCLQREAATAPSGLSAILREAVDHDLLPHLQRAFIIARFGQRDNFATSRRTTHTGFAAFDIVENQTTLVPVQSLETDGVYPGGREGLCTYGDWLLIRDSFGHDRFTLFESLSSLMEGPVTFRELIKMSASPRYELDLTQLQTREQAGLPMNVRMSLWERESKTGQCLLSAKEIPGLGMLPQGMAELLPSGWTYGRNNKKGEVQIEMISGF